MPQCLLDAVVQGFQSKRQATRETIHTTSSQNTSAPPQHTDNSTPPPPPPHGEEDTETDEGMKQHPVQETDPPPQVYENPQPAETPNPEGNVSTMDEDDDIQHSRRA
ncbi:uncharacterized protein LOC103468417 isoform X2 [Poecilia reticulata]|uniref:uncharacterized protein LOC103468417 isoform X2 n=1 Tax=Poecilia reticulata TaxID=8081 RepID=UPI0007E9BA98|nr:PREDICTED: uncharacterized protein LOC103468417 isoform X2 [Poecilia reticulata]